MADLNANHDTQIILVSAIFGSLTILSFVARVVSKRIRRTAYGLDDLLLGIALIAALIENVWFAVATHAYGVGHHLESLREDQISGFAKLYLASEITQAISLAFAKLSLVLLLHQIFVIRAFRVTCLVLAAIVIAWLIACILVAALNCPSLWHYTIFDFCDSRRRALIYEPIPWILTDLAVLVAPLPMIRKLHLPRGQKIGIVGLFLLGGVTCIASCIRYSTVWYTLNDVSWDIAGAICWTLIEADLGVIVVSLIVSRPVLARAVPDLTKFGSMCTTYIKRITRGRSTGRILKSSQQIPEDPPVLPSFRDSQVQFADKRKVVQDLAVKDGDIAVKDEDNSRRSNSPDDIV